MMERLTIDPASWSRTCLTETNEYLMIVAGALLAHDQAGQRHIDALRVNLAATQTGLSAEQLHPPMLTLSRANCEFLQLLEARYGHERIVLNLFRYSAKNWVESIIALLNRWGQTTLKNSDLVLNRLITIYRPNGEPIDQQLFSELLVEMAENIERCAARIESASELINSYYPAPGATAEMRSAEAAICKQLQLNNVGHGDASPGLNEEYLIRSIALEIASLAKGTCFFADQIAHNVDRAKSVILKLRSQWLQSEANRLFNFNWPSEPSLVATEVARNEVMLSLTGFTAAITDMEMECQTTFPGLLTTKKQDHIQRRLESLRGRLIADAMLAGLSGRDARESVVALIAYTEKHDVSAGELLTEELVKIHPALMPRTLEKFQDWTREDPVAQSRSSEKALSCARSAELKHRLAERSRRLPTTLSALLIVMSMLPIVSGCGLKTRPKNDVDDLRPAIPFRTTETKTFDAER